jgi:Protein of unknown function (DUF3285)
MSEPAEFSESSETTPPAPESPPPSFVKLAMRNMVRKRGTSIFHFTLTTIGLLGVLVVLSYYTR